MDLDSLYSVLWLVVTTVVARAVDSSGNRSAASNEIIVQCP